MNRTGLNKRSVYFRACMGAESSSHSSHTTTGLIIRCLGHLSELAPVSSSSTRTPTGVLMSGASLEQYRADRQSPGFSLGNDFEDFWLGIC